MDMIYMVNNFIVNLESFSMNDRILYFLTTLSVIFVSYFLVKPLVSILISLNSIYLLSYLISSMLILLIFLIANLMGGFIHGANDLWKFILQSLAVYGVILCLTALGKHVRDRLRT